MKRLTTMLREEQVGAAKLDVAIADMGEWRHLSLGALCNLITDGKHGDCENETDSGYFFLSVKDVFDNRLVYENARQITEKDFLETHRRTNLEPGDILFTNTGTIGRMAIAPDDPRTRRTTFQKSVAILKPRRNLVEPVFLYYTLKFDNARLSELAEGTTQKNLLLKDFRNFEVRIPSLPEQRHIAHILGTLDEKIELNRRMNETLEATTRALFKSWFVDFDPVRAKMEGRDPGLPKHLAGLFPDRLVDSGLGEIPEGWKVGRLGELADIDKGLSYKGEGLADDGGLPMVNLGCFGGAGIFKSENIKRYRGDFKERHLVRAGDLLVANTDMTQNRIILGSPALLPDLDGERSFLFTHHTFALRFKAGAERWRRYLYFTLLQPEFREVAEGFATGTTVLALPRDSLLNLSLVLPNNPLLDAFERQAERIFVSADIRRQQSRTLAALRDTLLPKLVSGELRLKDVKPLTSAHGAWKTEVP